MAKGLQTLYCNCTHAKVVPERIRQEALGHLCRSGAGFDAVADLCEMSARRDPMLSQLVGQGRVRIAACYPRAVKWIFSAAGAPLDPDRTEVVNMRAGTGPEVVARLQDPELRPNLPREDA